MFANAFDYFNLYIQSGSLNAPSDSLAELSRHSNARIRHRVAENANTDEAVLELLSKDPDPDVRIAVAANIKTPLSITHALANDPDPTVRLGIAQELNVPEEVLELLERDEHPYVRQEASWTLKVLESRRNLSRIDRFSMHKARRKEGKSSVPAGSRRSQVSEATG